jgi:hypothetical protein
MLTNITAAFNNVPRANNVIGNNYAVDNSVGFKSEVKHIFESYAGEGVNLSSDFLGVLTSSAAKESFIGDMLDSLSTSPLFTAKECANSPFYNNYTDRLQQLLDNSLKTIAMESAMTGYAPIVAYSPFFIKKQWIECVFKDVLMTEVPQSPVINLAFEKRYLKDLQGAEYPLPESLYDDDLMKILHGKSTGINFKEVIGGDGANADDPFYLNIADLKNEKLIQPKYWEDTVIADDPGVELTHGLHVARVVLEDDGTEYVVPVNIKIDITTHNFVNGQIKYEVKDAAGKVTKTLTDTILGHMDFVKSTITLVSSEGTVKKVMLRGKLANRWNERALDVVRRVTPIQHTMPESGPRLDSSITVEDASDALVLQNIDVIADNIDIMGRTLANFEDSEIKLFLYDSFNAQEAGAINLFDIAEKLTVVGNFNALPYDTFQGRISEWMKDSKEYLERLLAQIKVKLRSPDCTVVACGHPNLFRYFQDGVNWVFTDDTQISGMKIAYNFGIYTSGQDRVHFISSLRMKEDDGIRFVLIPLTPELVTFKHYKYNTIIDRNYRNPLHSLTPNIMCTHRTLTFEVLPVQGKLTIDGRGLFSPETLKRPDPEPVATPPVTPDP